MESQPLTTSELGLGSLLVQMFPYIIILFLTWFIYTYVLKIIISPLQKIPGLPFKPFIGNMNEILTKDTQEINLQQLERWAKTYGGLCRLYFIMGDPLILVTDPRVFKHILVTNCKNYQKPNHSIIKLFRAIMGNGLVWLEGVEHATHHRLISPSFNNASIKKMLPVFIDVGQKLTKRWIEQLKKNGEDFELEVQNDLSHAALDAIGRTAFGYDLKSFEDSGKKVTSAITGITEGTLITFPMTLPLYLDLPFPDVKRIKEAIGIFQNKVSEIIQQKHKQIKEKADLKSLTSDILGIMMLAKDESSGCGLSDEELRNEVTTIMAAGHETTSTGMTWFLKAISEHPEIQAKCQEEVRAVLPTPDTPITMEVLDKLTYLDMTIKETLRMYPPVPITFRQAQKDDVFLDKYQIPAGTTCTLNLRTVMRLPEYFEDPETFNPDRFNVSNEVENKRLYEYLPFLIGPRMCIGYKFALLQMRTILACFLSQLNFSAVHGKTYSTNYSNRITMRPHPPLVLHARIDQE